MAGDGISATLANFAVTTAYSDLRPQVIAAAEWSLLDAVGVSLAASALGDGCAAFADLVISEGGVADSTVLGFGVRVPAAAAALANGAMAHALDFEDAYDPAPCHPNAQVIPAVLALAEQFDVGGEALVTAIAVGCDLTCRLAASVGTAMADRGWYPPPIVGAIGAAAAGANLLGLDVRQCLDALSLVISQSTASGEVKRNPRSIVRGVRDSFAAHAAVRSVQLAQRGVAGFDEPLEGRYGFFASYAGNDYDEAVLLTDLGEDFAGPMVSFKPWPSCRATHGFVEAMLALRPHVDLAEIASIELSGSPENTMLTEPRERKCAPTTAIDAKFSLMFTAATALVTGEVSLESYRREALASSDVVAMARRVRFNADDAMTRVSDMSKGRATIRLSDGSSVSHEVESPLGSPTNPMSEAALRSKFLACAQLAMHPLEPARATELADTVLAIHSVSNLRPTLGDLLGRE